MIADCDLTINQGKNALIFKAFLKKSKSSRVDLLTQLGYDFEKSLGLNLDSESALRNRRAKLKKALANDHLYKIYDLFAKFIKAPNQSNIDKIISFNADNSGIIQSIVSEEITSVILSDSNLDDKLLALPAFLTVNRFESLTDNDSPLTTTSTMIAFDEVQNFINNSDIQALELMQQLINQRLLENAY